jgi:hypothetical protein
MAADFSKIFAQNGPVSPPTDEEYLQGFEFLGSNPPTYRLFNYMFQKLDLKMQYLLAINRQWMPLTSYVVGDIRFSINAASYKRFECVIAGTSGSTEPTWPNVGEMTADGTVTWIIDDVRDGTAIGRVIGDLAVRPGYIKANGATVNRATYPRLWKFAIDNGLTTVNTATYPGLFGMGDGSTTFSLPDWRGEFERYSDDGKGVDNARTIGSWQKGSAIAIDTSQSAVTISGLWYTSGNVYADALAAAGMDTFPFGTYSPGINTPFLDQNTGVQGEAFIGMARPQNIAALAVMRY